MTDYAEPTHPTREPEDVLAPSRYRAVKYLPHEGALVRLRNKDVDFDLDENGYPPYPLVGEIVEYKDHWTYDEYLVTFLDGEEEWYTIDDLIVISKAGNW